MPAPCGSSGSMFTCSLSLVCLFIHLFILLVRPGGGSFRQGLQQDPGCPLPAMRPAPGWAWPPESRSTSHHRISLCVPLGPLTARPPVLTCGGGGCSCDFWAGPREPRGPPPRRACSHSASPTVACMALPAGPGTTEPSGGRPQPGERQEPTDDVSESGVTALRLPPPRQNRVACGARGG